MNRERLSSLAVRLAAMFGSDASTWPQTLAIGIESIESGDFLTEGQKRDILYNNAARFLRLDEKNLSQKK